jgi:WD40 repeat protein
MGKSALLAAWLARREVAGAVVPHHFIRRGEYDWDDPAKLVGSLVAQIEARFPEQREPEADARMHPAARLDATLRRVSENELTPRGERLVVLIDGLDEYDPPAGTLGRDPLAAFLPRALPRGVNLVCASRPRHPYVDMLATRGAVQLDLDDERAFAADNEATVRVFWEQAAPELGLDDEFIAEAVARAGGNLQHAAMLRQHLAGLPPEQRRVEDIPRGLAALLASTWERIATDPVVVDGLGILCAAREALTLDELGAVAGWTGEAQRRAFLRGARELLVESRREGAVPEYRLHHDSIRGHIAGAIGEAALRAHHRTLAHGLATWPGPKEATARRYALRHALAHRAEAGEWADAWRLAADMGFVEAKCRELGAHDAEADLARVAERCRASGDETLYGRFGDLARALGRESHWLRDAPEATAALLWNRLRQSGWSADDIDHQLQVPADAIFLRVRHLATRESPALVRDLVGHSSQVLACAVMADSRRVVSASDDKTLKVWDLASGQPLATLQGHSAWVRACAVTPDGRRVVSASDDKTLNVWDLESGQPLATLQGHLRPVNACAVTPDSRHVVSASDDKTLKVWDLESGRLLATLQGHSAWVRGCAVTPDGRRVVSVSDDRTLKVWDLESGRLLATLQGHTRSVNACAVAPDGRRVVSASADQTLKVWDLESGLSLATLRGHSAGVRACAVTPDGRHVVSASDDKTLKIWDLASGHPLATLQGHSAGVRACAVTPNGRRVISASDDQTLKVWDLASGQLLAIPQGHSAYVLACAVTLDGRRVVSASYDQTLKVWDFVSGQPLVTLQGHSAWVRGCAVTPDGRRVVSASADQTLKVWDLESGQLLATLHGHTDRVHGCAVTPDGRRVISASEDQKLKVWDLESGQSLATLQGHSDRVNACAATPDGRRAVSASADQTLKVWDLESGQSLATLQDHSDKVNACAVTPDGRRVVSASDDKTLKVWDLESGQLLATLQGHSACVNACALLPDGRRVVSASDDKTLKVWDLESHACLLTHRANAAYLAVAATTTAIIAGDVIGGLWFLEWPPSSAPPFPRPR